MAAAAGRLQRPLLLVHGDTDATVPVEDARTVATAAGASGAIAVIEGAGHTFNVVHPFAGPSPELSRAVDVSVEAFGRCLEET